MISPEQKEFLFHILLLFRQRLVKLECNPAEPGYRFRLGGTYIVPLNHALPAARSGFTMKTWYSDPWRPVLKKAFPLRNVRIITGHKWGRLKKQSTGKNPGTIIRAELPVRPHKV